MGTDIGTESPALFGGPAGGATVGAAELGTPPSPLVLPLLLASDGRGAEGRLPLGEIEEIPGVGPLPVPSRGIWVSDEDDPEDERDCAKSGPRTMR